MENCGLVGQFSFSSNAGSAVKITKWSGREGVNVVVVSPQVVNLQDGHEIEIEIGTESFNLPRQEGWNGLFGVF